MTTLVIQHVKTNEASTSFVTDDPDFGIWNDREFALYPYNHSKQKAPTYPKYTSD